MKACLNIVHTQWKTYFFEITRHFWNASLYFSVKMMPNLSLAWDEENSEKQTNENALNKKHKSQKWDMQPLNPKL